MLSCIVDDSTIAQHEQHRGSQNYRTTLDLQRENKDLKKRLKRISNILAETEDQRKTDQAAFEKAMSHKDQEFATRLMDMNTAHVIENTQVNCFDHDPTEITSSFYLFAIAFKCQRQRSS